MVLNEENTKELREAQEAQQSPRREAHVKARESGEWGTKI